MLTIRVQRYSSDMQLVTNATIDGTAPARPGLVVPTTSCTRRLFKKITWKGKPFAGAKVDGHSVIVPDFGRVFFGELLIASSERRMTGAI